MFDVILEKSYKKARVSIKAASNSELSSSAFLEQILHYFDPLWPDIKPESPLRFGQPDSNEPPADSSTEGCGNTYFNQVNYPLQGSHYIIKSIVQNNILMPTPPTFVIQQKKSKYFVRLTFYASEPLSPEMNIRALDFFEDAVREIRQQLLTLKNEFNIYKRSLHIHQQLHKAIEAELIRRRRRIAL